MKDLHAEHKENGDILVKDTDGATVIVLPSPNTAHKNRADIHAIRTAIENVRSQYSAAPIDVVTEYAEKCIQFYGEEYITSARIERAMRNVIAAATVMMEELNAETK